MEVYRPPLAKPAPASTSSNARAKFSKRERVKLSAKGLQHLGGKNYNAATRGTVLGYGMTASLVRIIRDDRKTSNTYHCDFWERA